MRIQDFMLTAAQRGNPDTAVDRRHGDGRAWSHGNEVTPLVHGRAYFAALCDAVEATVAGDLVLFTDWRGDADEALDDDGTSVADVLCAAARRGMVVRGLLWRSHVDVANFSSTENRHLGTLVTEAGGRCLLDMRVRPGGSHHQKLVVVRHPGRPERDVAFVGGIDLCPMVAEPLSRTTKLSYRNRDTRRRRETPPDFRPTPRAITEPQRVMSPGGEGASNEGPCLMFGVWSGGVASDGLMGRSSERTRPECDPAGAVPCGKQPVPVA